MNKTDRTKSICPRCHKVLDACYEEEDGRVYLRKTCPEHGEFTSLIAAQAQDYTQWTAHPVINVPPKRAITKGAITKGAAGSPEAKNGAGEPDSECPLHCGTCENHLQTACCVLIDVTERCNQHCPYCFARAEEDPARGGEPSLAELARKYDLLLDLGEERPFNIQISGGEPTVRDDLPQIIAMGRQKGFEYIQINSNGRRLAEEEGYAEILLAAGASVIFMQFDGTDNKIYQALRGEPLWEMKQRAIVNCRKAGLPVTLVPTVVRSVNLHHVGEMMDFMLANVDVVKGIHFQPVSFFGRHPQEGTCGSGDFAERVTMFDVMREVERQTEGRFRYEDFCPITTGHTLCCFYGTYQKGKDGAVKSLISAETKDRGISCCDTSSPLDIIKKDRDFVLNKWELPPADGCCEASGGGSCCETNEGDCSGRPDGAATETCCGEQSDVAAETCCGQSGDATAEACCGESGPMDFDTFLQELKANMFTVSGMAFQDESNLDAERLKRCRVQVLTEDDRLIPFCAYNSIYR